MKAQILKIAGVKTEAEFYKKFPTEEAFMKKHGKKLQKAQGGISAPIGQKTFAEVMAPSLTTTDELLESTYTIDVQCSNYHFQLLTPQLQVFLSSTNLQ